MNIAPWVADDGLEPDELELSDIGDSRGKGDSGTSVSDIGIGLSTLFIGDVVLDCAAWHGT